MDKILLAVDGSEKSQKAVLKAKELASALEIKVTILTVISSSNIHHTAHSAYSKVEVDKLRESRKKEARDQGNEILNKTENILEENDINTDKLLRFGNPAEYICKIAKKNNYDVIIMADKGEGGVKRFLLGSTSDKVVHHAETSVLIVK